MNATVKRILSRLRLDKIAYVDRPCQEGAIVALIKRAEGTNGEKLAKSLYDVFEKSGFPLEAATDPDETAQVFDEVLGEQELRDSFWDTWDKGTSALQESVLSILKDDEVTDKSAQITESLKQFADYIETIIPGDIGKSIAAKIVASAGQAGTPLNKGDVMSVELKKALGLPETAIDADVMKAIADKDAALVKANEDLAKANEDLEKAKAPPPANDGDADDEMKKALASGDAFTDRTGRIITKKAAGELYEVVKAQDADLAKQAADLAKSRDADEERSFAKRAEDLGCASEFGSTLRKAYSGDATAQAELEKQIKGLNEQIDKGALFETFGKGGEAGSATNEFTAKVEEVKKAEPNLTYPQAFTKVYSNRTNRDLVTRMNAEQAAA